MSGSVLLDGGQVKHIHFVGIAGIGLSAIARVLSADGFVVSGSDIQSSALTEDLAKLGITVALGHRPENVAGADLVVVSSAVKDGNQEVEAARLAGVPVVKRERVLGDMMARKLGIAVAGTHGKTTTSAFIAYLLAALGLDPTFIVGGVLQDHGTNARFGRGQHFVVEADEYDHMFLGLCPTLAVITVIEMDHPDCYVGIEQMTDAFSRFAQRIPAGGTLIGCADQPRVLDLMRQTQQSGTVEVVGYGLHCGQWQARSIRSNSLGGSDFVVMHKGQKAADARIVLPGLHNVTNCLAVLAVTDRLGLDLASVIELLPGFHGVKRRFEFKGECAGITVIDDYAHHPTEICATLAAARRRFGARRIWVFFQPHTYTRTKALFSEFATSFDLADHVLVGEIFAARETDTLGLSGRDLVQKMAHSDARFVGSLHDAADALCAELRPDDVLVTLGAGDGYRVGEEVLARLRAQQDSAARRS